MSLDASGRKDGFTSRSLRSSSANKKQNAAEGRYRKRPAIKIRIGIILETGRRRAKNQNTEKVTVLKCFLIFIKNSEKNNSTPMENRARGSARVRTIKDGLTGTVAWILKGKNNHCKYLVIIHNIVRIFV
jgi:hypothetical protein